MARLVKKTNFTWIKERETKDKSPLPHMAPIIRCSGSRKEDWSGFHQETPLRSRKLPSPRPPADPTSLLRVGSIIHKSALCGSSHFICTEMIYRHAHACRTCTQPGTTTHRLLLYGNWSVWLRSEIQPSCDFVRMREALVSVYSCRNYDWTYLNISAKGMIIKFYTDSKKTERGKGVWGGGGHRDRSREGGLQDYIYMFLISG